MIVEQYFYSDLPDILKINSPSFVLVFGQKEIISPAVIERLNSTYPNSNITFCSTSGEITSDGVTEETITVTAVLLEKNKVQARLFKTSAYSSSSEAGKSIYQTMHDQNLQFLMVYCDGQLVNGDEFVNGLNEENQKQIPISGGLAGDGANFDSTVIGLNEQVGSGNIVAIGIYGESLAVNCGSKGGWSEFGPTRTITQSNKNVLYSIDDEPVLDLYKKYLGKYAEELPGSALMFPLALKVNGLSVVRTILNVNEVDKSLIFAGNVPEGAQVRLMKSTSTDLTNASHDAAEESRTESTNLAILVSCLGRKLVLKNRVDEEVSSAKSAIGTQACLTGFYSYGEISSNKDNQCLFHNQTMTITQLSEI